MKKFVCFMSLVMLFAGCTDSGSTVDRPLLETTWKLTVMPSQDIRYSGSQEPHLQFEAERVTGNDGCNNFFGPYKLKDDTLAFGLLASTRMACADIDNFDIAFNSMLLKTTHYRISGDKLELYAGDKLLAIFLAAENN